MEKRDLRVQKTYTALFNAFQDLLKKKKFEDISVVELCDKASIRTATFYQHFADKYEFVAFMIKELRHEFDDHSFLDNEGRDSVSYYLGVLKNSLSLVNDYAVLSSAIDGDGMMMLISQPEREEVRKEIYQHLVIDKNNGHQLAVEEELLTDILVGTMNQVSRYYLKHKEETTIEEMVVKMKDFITRMIG